MDSANECFSGWRFKNILKKREVHSTLDRFLTSLAKRQRPATEEEETYLD